MQVNASVSQAMAMNAMTAVRVLSVGQLAMASWLAFVASYVIAGRPLWLPGVVALFAIGLGAIVWGARNVPVRPSLGRIVFAPVAYASGYLGTATVIAWARGWLTPGPRAIDLVVIVVGAVMFGALLYDLQRGPRQ